MCGQSVSGTLDFPEDLLALRFPAVWLRREVALDQVAHDVVDQPAHAGEAAVADDILRQLAEKPLDQIKPGRTGRREVKMESRTLGEPLRERSALCGCR